MALKLAIVGAGPSAFYTASRILASVPDSTNLRIHMYDRLWTPHGLVRYGVAPDHPEVKNCTHKFDATAKDPRFKFFGNVNIGIPSASNIPHALNVSLSSLSSHYSHILFSNGCTVPALHEALPPSEYSTSALSLVHWYTQHPSKPSPPPLERSSHVSLIGNGNVALDIARMLLSPTEILQAYDVPSPVLGLLRRSAVNHVSIFARRGPLESAFTTKEIRELINLPNAAMVPLDPTILDTAGVTLTRQQSRILQLLRKGSKQPLGTTEKTWSLDFFRSPTGIVTPPVGSSSNMAQLSLAHTSVDPVTKRAVVTSESTTIPTSLVVTSIGFQSEPSNPFYDPGLRHLRAVSGRLVSSHGDVIRNAYASGWASMGPKGVLASTMIDAFSVAETMLADFASVEPLPSSSHEELQLNTSPDIDLESIPIEVAQGLREGNVVGYPDWQRIDAEEIKRGEALGKERERMEWEEAKAYLSLSS